MTRDETSSMATPSGQLETRSISEARAGLSRLIDGAVRDEGAVAITRRGTLVAVLLTPDRYDSLIETLSVLSDAPLVRDIREALNEA
jgi:prevent-host-death family protein